MPIYMRSLVHQIVFTLLILSSLLTGANPIDGSSAVKSDSVKSDIELYVLRPTLQHLGYIIPVRAGRRISEEIAEYKKRIRLDGELEKVFIGDQLDNLSLGQVSVVRNSESTKILAIANRGYDYEKSPEGDGRNRIEKFRQKIDPKTEMYILPVAITNYLTESEKNNFFKKLSTTFSGVIALGGADVDPEIYNESLKESRDVNLTRDRHEIQFLKYWIQNKKGFLYGVCRGHQLIAAALGYQLIQHIDHHGDRNWEQHKIELRPTTFNVFEKIFGASKKSVLVNSYHHQAVKYELGLNPEIDLAAVDAAGVVESLASKDGRIFTTQFHPEFMEGYVTKKIFSYLHLQFNKRASLSCQKLF